MDEVEELTASLLGILQLAGVLLALLAVFLVLFGIVRSMLRLAFSRAVLILPFRGGAAAGPLHFVLAEQLALVEEQAKTAFALLLKETAREETTTMADIGPLSSRALHELLDDDRALERAREYVVEEPVQLSATGGITVAGVTFSPDTVFAVSYYFRRLSARRTITGSLDTFGETVRLSMRASTGASRGRGSKERNRRGRRSVLATPLVFERTMKDQGEVLGLLDDVAFKILRMRFDLTSETESWRAWVLFQRGYAQHVSFVREGDHEQRDRAIDWYTQCIAADPTFSRAHYNLGNLLYDQYLLSANQAAIGHFSLAAHSTDTAVRALANAGLTMAYAQNVHRFELEPVIWIERAVAAAKAAMAIRPDLEESVFAQAWALQISGRTDDAIATYEAVLAAPGSAISELRVKSFARNNAAWLWMTQRNDLVRAEALLQEALNQPNKNVYANLGEVRRRQGRLDEALEMYASAVRLDPRYANGLNEMGMVLLQKACTLRGEARIALLDRGYQRHLDALAAVSDAGERSRLRRSFESFRRTVGLPANSVRRWSVQADRFAGSPASDPPA